MTTTMDERVINRAMARAETMIRIRTLIGLAEAAGFTHYRIGEWSNRETGRHFRVGYASDEWTISVGQVSGRKVTHILDRRIDLRTVVTGDQPIPAPAELFEQITRAVP